MWSLLTNRKKDDFNPCLVFCLVPPSLMYPFHLCRQACHILVPQVCEYIFVYTIVYVAIVINNRYFCIAKIVLLLKSKEMGWSRSIHELEANHGVKFLLSTTKMAHFTVRPSCPVPRLSTFYLDWMDIARDLRM